MGYLARFRSNVQLQSTALEVLQELNRRELLAVEMWNTSLRAGVHSRPAEIYVSGSRSIPAHEMLNAQLGLPTSDLSGPGITIRLRGAYRMGSDKEEKAAAEKLARALDQPEVRAVNRAYSIKQPKKAMQTLSGRLAQSSLRHVPH